MMLTWSANFNFSQPLQPELQSLLFHQIQSHMNEFILSVALFPFFSCCAFLCHFWTVCSADSLYRSLPILLLSFACRLLQLRFRSIHFSFEFDDFFSVLVDCLFNFLMTCRRGVFFGRLSPFFDRVSEF